MNAKPFYAVLALTSVLACGGTPASDQGERAQGAETSGASAAGTPGAPLPKPSGALRIATWNLEWLNRKNGTGPVKRSDADYARLRRYADHLDADVIAFQEVDGEEAARRVFDPAKYDVYVAAQKEPQRTGFAYRKGLRVSVHPDYAALDVGQVRVGADIAIELEGRVVRLLSVHLKSGCFDGPIDSQKKDCRKLFMQLPSLEAWIDARAEEGVAAIVLGDFNRRLFGRPGEPFWAELDDAQPPASDLWSPTEGITSKCWGGTYPQFIDHIVLNKPATELALRDSFVQLLYDAKDGEHKSVLSDHCPLAISLSPSAPVASPSVAHADRAARPLDPAPASLDGPDAGTVAQTGRIKGNVGANGRKLYHAPGCPEYARTKIDESKGERWFDSAKEAEAAGWTRAGNCP